MWLACYQVINTTEEHCDPQEKSIIWIRLWKVHQTAKCNIKLNCNWQGVNNGRCLVHKVLGHKLRQKRIFKAQLVIRLKRIFVTHDLHWRKNNHLAAGLQRGYHFQKVSKKYWKVSRCIFHFFATLLCSHLEYPNNHLPMPKQPLIMP